MTNTKPYMTALASILTIVAGIPDLLSDDYKYRQKFVDLLVDGNVLVADPESDDDLARMICEKLAGLIAIIRDDGYLIPTVEIEADWQLLRETLHENGSRDADAGLRFKMARQSLDDKIALLEAAWTKANAELVAETAETAEAKAVADDAIRARLLEAFVASGEKQIATGLSVRINSSYEFEDQDAVNFAIERKMPELLKPDRTAFGKQMKLTPQPWATKQQTASAVVSLKDLEGK